jgi:crotonobetainyl-CoA:carnitine CoA-transferase CaiB-like acyl-CoA transferase
VVDVALYESVFNVMESLLPEYDAFGAVRGAAGSALPGIAPSNAYRCAGGAYVLVAGNGDSIFRRLMLAIGRDDLATDPALAQNDGRVANVARIDAAIEAWTQTRPIDEVIATLDAAGVPVGRIYSVADIAADPQYLARDMIVQTHDAEGRPLKVPGIVPKLSQTPGRLRSPAPRLGEHNSEVLGRPGWPATGETA